MKKIFTLLLALLIIVPSFAQLSIKSYKNDIDAKLSSTKTFSEKSSKALVLKNIPYTQDFETDINGWGLMDRDNDGQSWTVKCGSSATPHSGTCNARSASTYGYRSVENWLVSPAINLTDAVNPRLSWWVSAEDELAPNEKYRILILTEVSDALWGGDYVDSVFIEELNSIDYKHRILDLSAYKNDTIKIAFAHYENDQNALNIDDIEVYEADSLDASVIDISTTSFGGCKYTATEAVTIKITNGGIDPISGFNVSYKVNDASAVTETFSQTIAAGATAEYTFAQTADLSKEGIYSITSYTSLPQDAKPENDESTIVLQSKQGVLNISFTNFSGSESETDWTLYKFPELQVVARGKAFRSDSTTVSMDLCVFNSGCYSFMINDGWGDGLMNPDMTTFGSLELKLNSNTIYENDGNFGYSASYYNIGKGVGCVSNDALMYSVDIAKYAFANTDIEISGYVYNKGAENIKSVELVFEIVNNQGEVLYTEAPYTVTGLDVATGKFAKVTHGVPASFPDNGDFFVFVTITKVNGVEDEYTENYDNTNYAPITVSSDFPQRVVLLEEVTNTSCLACAEEHLRLNKLIDENQGKVATIRYHMNYPDTADIFFLHSPNDGFIRMITDQGYGIWNYPDEEPPFTFVDAEKINPAEVTQEAIDKALETPALFEISGTSNYKYPGILEIRGTATSKANISTERLSLITVVIENHIEYNAISGETYFMYVMRDMLPSYSGIWMDSIQSPGNTTDFSFDYEIRTEKGWGYDVVVFVQDDDTKEIHQAAILTNIQTGIDDVNSEFGINIYPNPTTGILNITNVENSTINVINMLGEEVVNMKSSAAEKSINISHLPQGTYFVKVMKDGFVVNKKVVLTK